MLTAPGGAFSSHFSIVLARGLVISSRQARPVAFDATGSQQPAVALRWRAASFSASRANEPGYR